MAGLDFIEDETGRYVHDCRFPEPTQGATFVCPECEAKYWTAVHRTYHQWVWISEETGKAMA